MPESSTGNCQDFKVLVVEDTNSIRLMLISFIQQAGYQVCSAENGEIAVETFGRERPDLVLMDVVMPVMDGREATSRIKAIAGDRWVPVILLSAMSDIEDLVAGINAGADDYLFKPVNLVVLEAKLRSIGRTLSLQRKLETSTRQMAAMSENLVDGVIKIDEAGVIQWASQSALRIFGYTLQELLGRNIKMLMPEPYHSEHDGYIARYLQHGPARIIGVGQREVSGLRKSGHTFPMELGVSEMWVDGTRSFVGILRDISERKALENSLKQQTSRLQTYYEDQEVENELSKNIMQRMMQQPGLDDRAIAYWVSPAKSFSGDVVASQRDPQGKLYALLADATGHGLAASICTLPMLTTFYSLAQEGHDLPHIIDHLNQTLKDMLPVGRFVAAPILCLNEDTRTLQLWQGGTPASYWLNEQGQVRQRLDPKHLPLGILASSEELLSLTTLKLEPGDQFLMYSDGVIEAANTSGISFGHDRLERALMNKTDGAVIEAVKTQLKAFTEGLEQQDDVSLMLVSCH